MKMPKDRMGLIALSGVTFKCDALSTIQNRPLKMVAERFESNIERTYYLATFLPPLAFLNLNLGRWHGVAEERVLKGRDSRLRRHNSKLQGALNAALRQAQRESNYLKASFSEIQQIGVYAIDQAMQKRRSKNQFRKGVEPLIASVALAAWTAIETMSGDLWEAAVNLHPQILAQLKGSHRSWMTAGDKSRASEAFTEEDTDQETENDKSIKLFQIGNYDFNISRRMGSLLRPRFGFQVLGRIRKAYALAFSKDFENLKSLWCDSAFDNLVAVRNLLVHKAGVVDSHFVRQVRGLPQLTRLKENSRLHLEGGLVAEMIKAAVEKSVEIIKCVDDWIVAHPNKRR